MKRIELNDAEIQALADLMDAGVRHLGLKSVHNASALLQKLEKAEEVKDAETPAGLAPR
jgi:hypothetical protein